MATQAQVLANRENAKKSTGAKTEAGKAKCCRNRLTHGFASSIVIVPNEDREDFNGLLAEFHAEYLPVTHTEEILMEKMLQHHWNGLRAFRLMSMGLDNSLPFGDLPAQMSLLMRYHAASDRGFYKARIELITARKERENSEIGSEPQESVEPPRLPDPEPEPAPPNQPKTAPANSKMMDFGKFEAELKFMADGQAEPTLEQLAAEFFKSKKAA